MGPRIEHDSLSVACQGTFWACDVAFRVPRSAIWVPLLIDLPEKIADQDAL
jgi:hypothetical protein